MADTTLAAAAVAALACPVCGSVLSADPAGLRCADGHAFDRARQGYVHLAAGAIRHGGDTAVMVQARERVQAAGLFDRLTAALVAAVPREAQVILDLGAGTGHHLAAVLRALDLAATGKRWQRVSVVGCGAPGSTGQAGPVGIALDSSKPALRRAARAHPRLVGIAADVTGRLPLRDRVADVVLVTFAPRAPDELARVAAPGATLVVAMPTPGHLAELRGPLGMLAVPAGKAERLADALRGRFEPRAQRTVTHQVAVDRVTAVDLALMGPAGFHTDTAALQARARSLAPRTAVTIAIEVHTFNRAG
ncbi:MAG TPA: hypothetical protein VMM13_06960 [Euzebya sp.]|nr:hypothetical protein [Euzebya sp.]